MLLSGSHLQLVPYTEKDWEFLAKWFYDEQYRSFFRHIPKALSQQELGQYAKVIGGDVFLISLPKENQVVGLIQLIPDTKTNRAFYVGLLVDEQHQNQRYPTEAITILFDYAFNRLGYRKAIIEVLESDIRLNKTLTATGFLKEGSLVGEAFVDGKFVNEIRYCMLQSYFNKHKDEELRKKELWAQSLNQH